jgi:bifunctional non-homologous end joining protein LigD
MKRGRGSDGVAGQAEEIARRPHPAAAPNMKAMAKSSTLRVDDRDVPVSNLDKVLYPEAGFTKAQVIDYYIRISKVLLPHLDGRALTLKRYPNGVDEEFFYEKQCPAHRPPWVETACIPSTRRGKPIDYCIIGDLPTLVWAANLANLELHTSLARAAHPERPTCMVFDLDPGAPADIVQCCEVALWLRAVLDSLKLAAYPKTSGSKGLQVYVPLNTAVDFAHTKELSHAVAQRIESEHADAVVSQMAKNLRRGKVFIDWSQNSESKTTVCVYSLRAKDQPTVSTPVEWKEVERAAKKKDAKSLAFDWRQVLTRVDKLGDLFEPVLTKKQKLPR